MSEPKKPLITRERYRQYKRDQTTKPKPMTDEKKVAPKAKDAERSAPATETGNKAKTAKPKAKLFQKAGKPATSAKVERLTDKERGRKLDNYLNKSILIVILLIILVFAIAFVL